ncbi:hypothetical protein BMS3Abin15_01112 [bacterium BMS3Abin15]|nr:hypothetical protein BMS3Abin15_01112 [bacterium BMS3Abin15]
MRKLVLVFLILGLFISTDVFAAGDLVVNGQLGVGTSSPGSYKALILGTNQRGLGVNATSTTNNTGGRMVGSEYSVTLDGNVSIDSLIGQKAVLAMMSDYSGTVPGGIAAEYTFQIGTPDTTGTTNVTEVVGLQYTLNRHYLNTRTYNVTNSYGFLSKIQEGGPDNQAIGNVQKLWHYAIWTEAI